MARAVLRTALMNGQGPSRRGSQALRATGESTARTKTCQSVRASFSQALSYILYSFCARTRMNLLVEEAFSFLDTQRGTLGSHQQSLVRRVNPNDRCPGEELFTLCLGVLVALRTRSIPAGTPRLLSGTVPTTPTSEPLRELQPSSFLYNSFLRRIRKIC